MSESLSSIIQNIPPPPCFRVLITSVFTWIDGSHKSVGSHVILVTTRSNLDPVRRVPGRIMAGRGGRGDKSSGTALAILNQIVLELG